jgi:23S rRNA (pseudouridine1915-N3)-methyltransferase
MQVTVCSVGKPPRHELQTLIQDYEKRLKHIQVNWQFIKPSPLEPELAMQREAQDILKALQPQDYVLLLDERGTQKTSELLSSTVFSKKQLVFVIGGPYGVAREIKQRADEVISLGLFVLPHQLVRLILAEQLYRAETIYTNHPYHHA